MPIIPNPDALLPITFSVLWFMSVGLTPAQAGFLKSLGQMCKLVAQPAWAALADMRILVKCHKVFENTHMHVLAVISLLLSLVSIGFRVWGSLTCVSWRSSLCFFHW